MTKYGRRRREQEASQRPDGLPQTYAEHVAKVRPHIVKDVARMVRLCGEKGIGPTYETLDEVPFFDRNAALMRELDNQADHAKKLLRRTGITRDEYKIKIRRDQDALRWLLECVELDTHQLLRHSLSGGTVMRIAPALAERLAETRMNVPTERMKLPHPTMLLVFDDEITSEAFARMTPDTAFRSRVINVMVSEFEVNGERKWYLRSMRIDGETMEALAMRSLRLTGSRDAEEALRTDWKEINGEENEHARKLTGKPVRDDLHYKEGLDFYRIIINALLYITSHNPSTKQATRFPAAGTGPRSPVRYVVAGADMTPLSSTANDEDGTKGIRFQRSGVQLHVVRGHWKNQAYGPGRKAHKHIFVEPYMRGDDADRLIARTRLVA